MNIHDADFPADDPLELAVRAMKNEAVPAGPSAETIANTLKLLEKREHDSPRTILSIPRSRLMKIAKAGSGLLLTSCVLVAIVALRSPTSVYAQAIENARKAKSMSYLMTIKTTSLPTPAVVREYVAEDGRCRTEMMMNGKPSGLVSITDAAGFVRLTLADLGPLKPDLPLKGPKTAMVYPARQAGEVPKGGPKNSWLKSLQSLGDKPDKELGEKQLDGKTVRGFEAVFSRIRFQLWVDAATGRPVRIEYDTDFAQHVTMTDFQFNQELDESLFSFEPPAGYLVQTMPLAPKAAGGEESVLIALRGFTDKSAGTFPASLTEWGEWSTLLTKGNQTAVPDADTMRVLANLGAITPFLSNMDTTDYAYRGKGKTTRDKDAIVFWYRKPDGVYRAIYGDLSARDLTPQDVPKD